MRRCQGAARESAGGARAGVGGCTAPLRMDLLLFALLYTGCIGGCGYVFMTGEPDEPGIVNTLNRLITRDLIDAIRASKGALGHVQLSENHRGTPGTGQVAFAAVLAALAEIDYRGWLVVEAFSRQDPAFGSMLRIWRSLDAGPEAVMAAGAGLLGATR